VAWWWCRSSTTPAWPPPPRPVTTTGPAADSTTYVSVHDQRVALVAAALRKNSKLDEKASVKLAGHALDALDHIPEKVR